MFLTLALAFLGDPAASAAAQPEKKICRNADADLGSMMPKRECKTKAEWAAIAKANQQNADNYKRNRAHGGRVQSSGGL
jgi:hypothetical protein